MKISFDVALAKASDLYPHEINHYEEYEDYFVFDNNDGDIRYGGTKSPVVIRKSDGEALNYASIFFNMDLDAEDVGDLVSEGRI